MPKRLFLLIVWAILLSHPLAAQNRKRTPAKSTKSTVPVLEQARQAIDIYDFDHAAELLSRELSAQRKKRKPTVNIDSIEAQLEKVQSIALKLHATERIIIIDSVVCTEAEALKAIRLTHESGRIDTYASTYHSRDTLGATIYENELANKRYLAVPATTAEGGVTLRLAVSDKIGENWSDPTPLSGLGEDDITQNFPFLLSDGVTLYYAAKGPESIGGYDLFVTRSDGEDGSFLAPENMGFPFNSFDNDYLLAIDELAQLGWFITDRRQPEDMVCVYTFIPNDTRETYGDETSDEQLRDFARLCRIRDTWSDESAVAQAQQRLADLRAGKAFGKTEMPEFTFVIDDSRTYTRLSDFKSPTAREKMQRWLQLSKNVETDATMLQRLRDSYATAQPAQRTQLATTIRQLESTHYPNLQHLQQLAKEIRNAEIAKGPIQVKNK